MKKTKYQVEFHFGVREIEDWKVYVAALFLNLAVILLSKYTKAEPMRLWALIDEIGRHYDISVINEVILRVPELLQNRISRDVDKAIDEYKDVVEWEEPKIESVFSEKKEGETLLGGEMRIRAPWVKDND